MATKCVSLYIYAETGKHLIENGKDIGEFIIAPESKDLTTIQNIGKVEKIVEYTADEGKIFKHKTTGETAYIIKEIDLPNYDEVDDETKENQLV